MLFTLTRMLIIDTSSDSWNKTTSSSLILQHKQGDVFHLYQQDQKVVLKLCADVSFQTRTNCDSHNLSWAKPT